MKAVAMTSLQPRQFTQPVLTGMPHTEPSEPVAAAHRFLDEASSKYSGPIPGQLVMGVHDLGGDSRRLFAHQHAEAGHPFYEVDKTGFVQEPERQYRMKSTTPADAAAGHNIAARDLYDTHGGRMAKTYQEHYGAEAKQEGYGDRVTDYVKDEYAEDPVSLLIHNAKVTLTHRHWDKQPIQQIRSDAPVHTAQQPHETLVGNTGDGRTRISKIRNDLQQGGEIREPAWMMKKAGRLYALDGHHRVVAAREEGKSHYPARVWDLDAEVRR